MSEIKRGLVLEGGAMRGMFSCGVTDVLMENNIEFDGAIGVSAGIAFGCNVKSRQIGRAIRYNMKFADDPEFKGIRSLITSGDIYNVNFSYNRIPNELDLFDTESYKANPMELYAVATDVETGKPVYQNVPNGDAHDLEWYRASASIPVVSRIVEVDGYKLLDGGLSDSIPLKKFISMGYNRNLVILTQPDGYQKKKNNMMPLIKVMYHKYPNFVRAIERRHIMYNRELLYVKKAVEAGKAFAIYPPVKLEVSPIEKDKEKLKEVYEIGRKTAEEKLEQIKAFLTE